MLQQKLTLHRANSVYADFALRLFYERIVRRKIPRVNQSIERALTGEPFHLHTGEIDLDRRFGQPSERTERRYPRFSRTIGIRHSGVYQTSFVHPDARQRTGHHFRPLERLRVNHDHGDNRQGDRDERERSRGTTSTIAESGQP